MRIVLVQAIAETGWFIMSVSMWLRLGITVQEELRTVVNEMRGTVCFYVLRSDTYVVAARSMGLEPGQICSVTITG